MFLEARTPSVIMYHGTAFKNLRSIMSYGLLPNPKGRAWSLDNDSGFNNASRASLEGVYLTRNLMTALSAASNGANRQHMKEGDLLVAVEMQPKTAFADEDDLNSLSVVSDHSYLVASLYNSWKNGTDGEFLEDHMEKYKNRFLSRISFHMDVHPALKTRLWEMLDRVFVAALERQAAYVGDVIKRNFKGVEPPNRQDAESKYMRVREKVTRTMKSLANPFSYSKGNDKFSLTARVVEPIGFRGVNKIICVLHVPFDYEEKPTLIYGRVPEDLISQWGQSKGEWRGLKNES